MPPAPKSQKRGLFAQPSAAASTTALELAISANQIASNHPGLNPYQLRNELLIEQEKERICTENGKPAPTRRPKHFFVRYDASGKTGETPASYTAQQLEADADRKGANHRRTLDRNLRKGGHQRVPNVCAHHIVASRHPDAHRSRVMLFRWGIGINDADNGVYLPAYAVASVPSLPAAVPHDRLHLSPRYYLRVEARLMLVNRTSQPDGRSALRQLRSEMVAGSFALD